MLQTLLACDFANQKFTDFTIKDKAGGSFKAHKLVLQLTCEYFKTYFTTSVPTNPELVVENLEAARLVIATFYGETAYTRKIKSVKTLRDIIDLATMWMAEKLLITSTWNSFLDLDPKWEDPKATCDMYMFGKTLELINDDGLAEHLKDCPNTWDSTRHPAFSYFNPNLQIELCLKWGAFEGLSSLVDFWITDTQKNCLINAFQFDVESRAILKCTPISISTGGTYRKKNSALNLRDSFVIIKAFGPNSMDAVLLQKAAQITKKNVMPTPNSQTCELVIRPCIRLSVGDILCDQVGDVNYVITKALIENTAIAVLHPKIEYSCTIEHANAKTKHHMPSISFASFFVSRAITGTPNGKA